MLEDLAEDSADTVPATVVWAQMANGPTEGDF